MTQSSQAAIISSSVASESATPTDRPGALGGPARELQTLNCFIPAAGELISRKTGLAYLVRDGNPIMLPDEARRLEEQVVSDRAAD